MDSIFSKAKLYSPVVLVLLASFFHGGCAQNQHELRIPPLTPYEPQELAVPETPEEPPEEPASETYVLPVLHPSPRLSSDFGFRRGRGRQHKGIDLEAPQGTPVVATRCGQTTFSGWDGAYGNIIVVCHGDGTEAAYAHLKELHVGEHESVKQGQVIGLVGRTGNATGPHLHFEIRKEGARVDPKRFVSLSSGEQRFAASE